LTETTISIQIWREAGREAENDTSRKRLDRRTSYPAERGIPITGPDPKTLIDPVSPDDMRLAIINGVPLWVNPLLADPSELNKRGFQSFFVLSLCRMMYTLKHGDVLSKYAAAEWGKENLDERWTPLIERALLGRQYPDLDAEPEDIRETLEMMRYMLGQVQPTPYPEVNEILGLLLFNAKEILGDGFVGMYLYGSLSSGDFDPNSSDIDFLVVTTDIVADKTISELEAMHNRIWATGLKWASKLEGSYVPKELIRHHDPDGAPCPTVNEGAFFVDKRGSDWIIQRHIVREYGVVLAGPDPKTLIDPVTADDIRGSVLGILQEWWFPMLDDPSWLRNHGSEYQAFAVISMCRVLHALEHGTIVSKPTSIQWAREKLGEPWLPLIEKAVAASRHEDPGNFLAETLDFIQFTKEQTENFEK
jgi:predicted nucleotidyltransferase